jgi:uncharacterized delta-60 repeat protein
MVILRSIAMFKREVAMKYLLVNILLWLAIILLACSSTSTAQVTEAWVQHYQSPDTLFAEISDMVVDGEGNVYVTGNIVHPQTYYDYLTIKYDSSGTLLWTAEYTSPGNKQDEASAIDIDKSGNVYVTGLSVVDSFNADCITIKYNTDGVPQWIADYNGPAETGLDWGLEIEVTQTGDVYVAAASDGSPGNLNYAVIKYNTEGVQQWVERYDGGGPGGDWPRDLKLDDYENVYVTGSTSGIGTDEDYTTIKYNSRGRRLWVAQYRGSHEDEPECIVVDRFENVIVTGRTVTIPYVNDFYLTIKYDRNGIQQWTRRFATPGTEYNLAWGMVTNSAGEIYVTGQSFRTGSSYDIVTLKYSPSGSLLWLARYNGPTSADDAGRAIDLDPQGNIYVTGTSMTVGIDYDFVTIKYNPAGQQQWTIRYSSPSNLHDWPVRVVADAHHRVYVAGTSEMTGYPSLGPLETTVIKYNQTADGELVTTAAPKSSPTETLTATPSPFNAATLIRYQMPEAGRVSLRVYDITGALATSLVEGWREAGVHEVTFDGARLPSGVYLGKLVTGELHAVIKLALIK